MITKTTTEILNNAWGEISSEDVPQRRTPFNWMKDTKLKIEDIELLSKEQYKTVIKEAVYKKAFVDLLLRKQSTQPEIAKGKQINYSDFQLPEYLSPNEEDLSIVEQKLIFYC